MEHLGAGSLGTSHMGRSQPPPEVTAPQRGHDPPERSQSPQRSWPSREVTAPPEVTAPKRGHATPRSWGRKESDTTEQLN